MSGQEKQVLLCNCDGTMTLDGETIAKAFGGEAAPINSQLCRAQLGNFDAAIKSGSEVVVACTQESPLFLETFSEFAETSDQELPEPAFVNIREKAGWSDDAKDDAKKVSPKIAALLAESEVAVKGATVVEMSSDGIVLIIGRDQAALDAAKQLASRMDVTLLLTGGLDDVIPPRLMDVPVFAGRVEGAQGHLGSFEVRIQGFAPVKPSSRGTLELDGNGQNGTSQCDIIIDLRGDTPLFSAPEKRDGYLNPDPGNPALVQKALFEATDMVGTFQKPRYIDYQADICAHSRSEIKGCTRCLDLCPTGAITPAGNHVEIDPYVCAGCGSCASHCPTGAASYALPQVESLLERARVLLGTYLKAGGKAPAILVHDLTEGEAAIDMMARFGRGLPANVIPFAVNEVTQVGLDFLAGCFAYGAQRIDFLVNPAKAEETEGLVRETTLMTTILEGLGYGAGRVRLLIEADPLAVEENLWEPISETKMPEASFLALGKKRGLLTLSLLELHKAAPTPVDILDLPKGAPFGYTEMRSENCTLCHACVGSCPTGALKDNPDLPQLRFQENACVQCGLCQATCPEKVITLKPRLNFTEEAKRLKVRKEEQPFHCIRCGKPYGTQSSIDNLIDKLSGHSMFQDPGQFDRLKMCEDCRVVVMSLEDTNPLAGAPRPITRTTDDYLRERDELRAQAQADIARREPEKPE
ncbi:MAG: 4Fe-4S dicluster domain-containing protein [Magnetovibrionaceae bacterium]